MVQQTRKTFKQLVLEPALSSHLKYSLKRGTGFDDVFFVVERKAQITLTITYYDSSQNSKTIYVAFLEERTKLTGSWVTPDNPKALAVVYESDSKTEGGIVEYAEAQNQALLTLLFNPDRIGYYPFKLRPLTEIEIRVFTT